MVECLAASLFVPTKETPKRIPTPFLIIGIAAYQLLIEADLKDAEWPTLSEIRRKAQEILTVKFKKGPFSILTNGHWREALKYFALTDYFPKELFGSTAKAEKKETNDREKSCKK